MDIAAHWLSFLGIAKSIGYFLVLLGVLVSFHELGHFLFAKLFGIKVMVFSLGMGPKLFSFRWGETEYRIAALPLGGYVKMLGDQPDAEVAPEDANRSLYNKPLWQRSLVLLGGPGFNFLLALLIYCVMFSGMRTFGDTRLGIVTPDGPAWHAGLRPGDKILQVNDKQVTDWTELRDEIVKHPDGSISVLYVREGKQHRAMIRPKTSVEENIFKEKERRGRIGVSLQFVKPIIFLVDQDSPAVQAGLKSGDEITSIGGQTVHAWYQVRRAVSQWPKSKPIAMTLKRGQQSLQVEIKPNQLWPREVPHHLTSSANPVWGYTGLVSQEAVIAKVDPKTPAAEAGLKPGDRLLRVAMFKPDGVKESRDIGIWSIDLAFFQGRDARNEFELTLQRGAHVFHRKLHLSSVTEKDEMRNEQTRYVFGAFNDRTMLGTYEVQRHIGIGAAFIQASRQVGNDMTLVAQSIAKMVSGKLSIDSMGGPIMLFVIADKSAEHGWMAFTRMMALISVNLGLLNLLPIPVLDGGHLLFFLIEGVSRRPPSRRVRELSHWFGLAILILLMVVVFTNDIMRFIVGS